MPRARPWILGTSLALCACGGGGGSGGSESLHLDLGLLPSTAPSRLVEAFGNPLSAAATVTAGPATGPFSLDPADLPGTAGDGAAVDLGVVFAPTSAGDADGSVTLHFDGGFGRTADRVYSVHAVAEAVSWTLLTPSLAFGEVLVGGERDLFVDVRNDASVTPGTLSAASLPAGGFALVGPPLPLLVAPGATASLAIRYAPTAPGAPAGDLRIERSDPGGPFVVPVSATTGGEVVTDFGSQSLDGSGRTPLLTIDVPADAISLTLEGSSAGSDTWGLGELTGPGGREYENAASTGAYVWIPGDGVFTATVPNTDRAAVQLVAGGGTYSFRLKRLSGAAIAVSVRAIIERRPGGNGSVGVLDLDVWLALAIAPKAATASTDVRLQAVLASVDGILSQRGIRLGDVRYHDVTNAAYDDVTDAEFPEMLKLSAAAPTPRLNLFFVRTALGGGVLGVSSTIAGPKKNGTPLSGVMSLYDGSHDFVDDTADCPASGTNSVCPQAGGGYLMHWQAVGGTTLTAGQGLVIRGHPIVEPALLPAALHAARVPVPVIVSDALPAGWCGTRAPLVKDGR